MEPVLMMNKSADYNRRNFITNRSLNSYPYSSDDLLLASFIANSGHLAGNSLSFPANVSVLPPPHHRQLPPLLPLPISTPINHHHKNMNMKMNIYRSNSNSSNNSNSNANIRLVHTRNNKSVVKNRVREHSLTPKKSKNHKRNLKREETDPNLVTNVSDPDLVMVPPTVTEAQVKDAPLLHKEEHLGPDPLDLPKDVIPRVFSSSINKTSSDIVCVNVDKFSGSVVFTPSPPPSSLPLPTFSIRSKLGCKAEAVSGVDAGATDSLRRLLRL